MDKDIEQLAKDFCKATPRINTESGVVFYERLIATLNKAEKIGRYNADNADNLLFAVDVSNIHNVRDALETCVEAVEQQIDSGRFDGHKPKDLFIKVYK
jgi:hypothetical protein